MQGLVGAQLSIMMFLQFFIWGAWYVTAPRFLGTIGYAPTDFGWLYSVGPISAIISPFFLGIVADRFFSTERVLGTMHLLAGGTMLAATTLMLGDYSPDVINLVFFAHTLSYFPTLSLTNTLAMHNMEDSEKQFPIIRVFGTIGWIVAGWTLGRLEWGDSINMFYLAGGAALTLGLYSFTLPHTPPPSAGKKVSIREILGVDAFSLLKQRSFLMFMISSFLICIPLAFYYQMGERSVAAAGVSDTPTKMTFGQISEIVFMLLIPFFFRALGVKWMLFVGMAAWVARYVLFAAGTPDEIEWMMLAGVILHGICYDFFFVTGQIYTDKTAPAAIRGQAQGMLVLFTLGLGMLIGAQVGGLVEKQFTPPESTAAGKKAEELGEEIKGLEDQLKEAEGTQAESLKKEIAALKERRSEFAMEQLKLVDWRKIWTVPAVGAAVVMLLFAFVFKDQRRIDEEISEGDVADAAATEEFP